MARRMYDLDNGTENIKVKKVVTDSVLSIDGLHLVRIDNTGNISLGPGSISIGVGVPDSEVVVIYSPVEIRMNTEEFGGITLNDQGFVFSGLTAKFSGANLVLPTYTTALRPTAAEGMIIYDSTLKKCILYNGTAWVNLDGSALGA